MVFFSTCLLLFYKKNSTQAARRGRQVPCSPKNVSLQPIFGTNWASLLNAIIQIKKIRKSRILLGNANKLNTYNLKPAA